jgi:glycosyltransferase involved in cell wall biosynthesis
MKISVIIPGWNREVYFVDAIESVLDQKIDPEHTLEIIVVVDENPSDCCGEVAERYLPRVKVVKQANNGASASRNCGMTHATGDFFAFLDSDDFWHPDKIQVQVDYLLEETDIGVVFTHEVGFEGAPPRSILMATSPDPETVRPAANVSSFLGRAGVWEAAGPLDESLSVGEFIDWYGRVETAGIRSRMIEQPLVYRRAHDSNQSRLHKSLKSDYLKTLQQHLRRRRELDDAG